MHLHFCAEQLVYNRSNEVGIVLFGTKGILESAFTLTKCIVFLWLASIFLGLFLPKFNYWNHCLSPEHNPMALSLKYAANLSKKICSQDIKTHEGHFLVFDATRTDWTMMPLFSSSIKASSTSTLTNPYVDLIQYSFGDSCCLLCLDQILIPILRWNMTNRVG
jgi:hypothetical protein